MDNTTLTKKTDTKREKVERDVKTILSNTDEVGLGPCVLLLFSCICAWGWFWWLPARTSTLCASVLEPDFDLTLWECQSFGQSRPLCSCQVLCCGKCLLKFFNLISRERCTSFLLFLAVFWGRVLFVVARLWYTVWRCRQRTGGIDQSRGMGDGTISSGNIRIIWYCREERRREERGRGREREREIGKDLLLYKFYLATGCHSND